MPPPGGGHPIPGCLRRSDVLFLDFQIPEVKIPGRLDALSTSAVLSALELRLPRGPCTDHA